jgi:DNA (cytosine-5)-methyltransferase 1
MRGAFTFLEFFAGGGMARLGLGPAWRCLFANDFDPMKRAAYGANFGLDHHHGGDVARLTLADLPATRADLAWASSPCQDLSLAGARGGLAGGRSAAFFGFWRAIEGLAGAGRAPRLIVVENVAGLLSSNGGADFAAIIARMAGAGYDVGALLVNASAFVPQSRPRLFIVAARAPDPAVFRRRLPPAAPAALTAAVEQLPPPARRRWRWIAAQPAAAGRRRLEHLLDESAPFDPPEATARLIAAMAPRQRAALDALARAGGRHVGAAFRRVRVERGAKRARIEARFDGLAGCIRTPAGGSSRQIILIVEGARVRSRLMTPREAARVMGLPDDYRLPERPTAALALVGDGVAPPVVAWLAANVLEPALAGAEAAA